MRSGLLRSKAAEDRLATDIVEDWRWDGQAWWLWKSVLGVGYSRDEGWNNRSR